MKTIGEIVSVLLSIAPRCDTKRRGGKDRLEVSFPLLDVRRVGNENKEVSCIRDL